MGLKYEEGFDAGRNGQNEQACPYALADVIDRSCWIHGMKDGYMKSIDDQLANLKDHNRKDILIRLRNGVKEVE